MEKRQSEHPEVTELFELLRSRCEPDYFYRQLAEECVELAQVALKVVRANNGEMPLESAVNVKSHYLEELADVAVMWNIAEEALSREDIDKVDAITDMKLQRMKERLERMPDRENVEATDHDVDNRLAHKVFIREGGVASAKMVKEIITEMLERMFED